MNYFVRVCFVGLSLLLAACGGGGAGPSSGGGGSTTPPPPPPPPPPPDDPSVFNTTEFKANWGLGAISALAAYDDGLTGAGKVVAVIDTGIDVDQTDLDDNIHPASKDIFDGAANTLTTLGGATTIFSSLRTGGGNVDDIDGHGTFVSGLIAAEKNDLKMHGLAFEAQVLAVRTDDSDSCPDDCLFDDNAIAASVNYAVANGADIINISLGGSPANAYLEGALRDAVTAGAIIVISAGNAPETSGTFTPAPDADPLALAALETWANGQIIIAGATNSSGGIADFSNRAGVGAAFYVLAPGESVYSTTVVPGTGASTYGTGSGTSFSAPLVAAAAALLMEKFPALTAAEIVEIILITATDMFTSGVDPVTGHGLLDLEAAIAPIGITSVSIKTESGMISVDPGAGGVLVGGAFGDGFGHGFAGGAVFTDVYDRAYRTGFDGQIIRADASVNFLSRFEAAQNHERALQALGPGATLSFGARYNDPLTEFEAHVLGLTSRGDDGLSSMDVRVDNRLGDRTRVSMGFGGALDGVLDRTAELESRGAFLAQGTRLPWLSDTAFEADRAGVMTGGRRYGVGHALAGGLVLSVAAAQDDIEVPALAFLADDGAGQAARSTFAARLSHADPANLFGWSATFGHVEETGVVLGSFSSGAFRIGHGAETDFLALSGHVALAQQGKTVLSMFGHAVGASVNVDEAGSSGFSGYEGLTASQFALGLMLDDALVSGDRMSLTLSQPLRLETGRVVYGFASGYDYDTQTSIFDDGAYGLAPSGRELDVEVAYHAGFAGVRMSANLLYQRAPGHVAGQSDAVSVMVSGRRAF